MSRMSSGGFGEHSSSPNTSAKQAVKAHKDMSKHAKAAEKAMTTANQLKPFGCELSVTLMLHQRGATAEDVVRRQVRMSDSLKWTKFVAWALTTLYGKDCKHGKDYLTFEYVNEVGTVVSINNLDSLRQWINLHWFQQPLILHVVESGAQKQSEAQESFVEELFLRFDLNGDGEIDPHEQVLMRARTPELRISRTHHC